jgi:hypothetical protein
LGLDGIARHAMAANRLDGWHIGRLRCGVFRDTEGSWHGYTCTFAALKA